MKKFVILFLLLVACAPVNEKVFVANEASGSISVIDASSLKEIDRVSLIAIHEGARVEYAPHNVQVVGDKVLITANIAHDEEEKHEGHDSENSASHGEHEAAGPVPKVYFGVVAVEAHGEEKTEHADHPDQLIIMDAKSHKIVDRLDFDVESHLAHVVSDGTYAYATSTNEEVIFKVQLNNGLYSEISLPEGSMPHGIRLTADGRTAVVAAMGNALLLVDLVSKKVDSFSLPGKGVQAGAVNNIAMASVFDTKQLALLDLSSKELSFVDLPGAVGPVQMYWTTDGKYVYVADQGVYFDQPAGRNTYKVDLSEKKVIATIDTGDAPHGVVVSPDGRVWVTNLNGNSISVIENDKKVSEIPVGAAPNGISFWSLN
jgi:YVTN family beta-propeller protein